MMNTKKVLNKCLGKNMEEKDVCEKCKFFDSNAYPPFSANQCKQSPKSCKFEKK